MKKEIKGVIGKLSEEGLEITDEEVDRVLNLCERKMRLNGIENREEYLPLLLEDEIRNYLFQKAVNEVCKTVKEMEKSACVQNVV